MTSSLPSDSFRQETAVPEQKSLRRSGVQSSLNTGFTFFGDHEQVGIAPTQILKPIDTQSRFKSYAFSKSGTYLVTGETNGKIRVWNTKSYREVLLIGDIFSYAVTAVSFQDGSDHLLAAVDIMGHYHSFKLRPCIDDDNDPDIKVEEKTPTRLSATLQSVELLEEEHEISNSPNRKRHQFSEDGRVLACFAWDKSNNSLLYELTVYRMLETGYADIHISHSYEFVVPSLAPNGQSILACTFRKTEFESYNGVRTQELDSTVYVIPELDFNAEIQHEANIACDRALWGIGGKFLLTWSMHEKAPRLSVYRTKTFKLPVFMHRPLRSLDLGLGLYAWHGQMIEHKNQDRIEVLIYERGSSAKVRLLIWDVVEDVVTREIHVSIDRQWMIDRGRFAPAGNGEDGLVEYPMPARSNEAFYDHVMEDEFPDFCFSENVEWVGLILKQFQSFAVSSVQGGVTIWRSDLPESIAAGPSHMPLQIRFDPSEQHFMTFSDTAIVVSAPCFLDKKMEPYIRMRSLDDTAIACGHLEDDAKKAYRALPSEALAKTWGITRGGGRRRLTRSQTQSEEDEGFVHYLDAAVSRDGSFQVLITRDLGGSYSLHTMNIVPESQCSQLSSPPMQSNEMHLPITDKGIAPNRVFLYPDQDGVDTNIVLISIGHLPFAIYCDVEARTYQSIDLPLSKCLSLSQTEDCTRLIILDSHYVRFFDLRSQTIVDEIRYKVDFEQLLRMTQSSTQWQRAEHEIRDVTERRISDDGYVVLLAWDTHNGKSITVTPPMDQKTCEEAIRSASASLSDSCVLTANGSCTLFVDIDEIRNGNITVATFHEPAKRVVSRVHVVNNLPVTFRSNMDIRCLLSNVFYGLSEDGKELIAVTTRSFMTSAVDPNIENTLRRFSIHGTAEGVPSYHQMSMNSTTSIETSMKELAKRHGFFVFNTPSSSGMSFSQDVVMARNWSILELLQTIATQRHGKIALHWTSPEPTAPNNLLQWALQAKSTTSLSKVMDLMSSELTPFSSVAKIMKDSFVLLAAEYCDTLEIVLSENRLVREACKLNVHVEFMNTSRRTKTAVHIGSTNTFLDWTLVDDRDTLDENWKKLNVKEVEEMEKKYRNSTKTASLKFVAIANAAMPGLKGIIRPLLFQGVPSRFFQFDVVKWVIMFKWFKIWQKRYLWDALIYFAFLVIFITYSSLLATSADVHVESNLRKQECTWLVTLMFVFGVHNTAQRCRQIKRFISDGTEGYNSAMTGMYYYMKFSWNWVDWASCLLLVLFIPLFHALAFFMGGYNKELSFCIAAELILAACKVWYFAQPFAMTGALVRMFRDTIKDCMAFLWLSFVIMVGFALALHVITRTVDQVPDSNISDTYLPVSADILDYTYQMTPNKQGAEGTKHVHHQPSDNKDASECARILQEAHGTFYDSMLSLFFAILGSLEVEVYRCAGDLAWLTTLTFVVYLLIQAVVLFNLLISIMGDTFDRVRKNEEAQLLMSRATFIDASEASLSNLDLTAIEHQTGKYLYILMDENVSFDQESQARWSGKLDTLERSFKRIVVGSELRMERMLQEQTTESTAIDERLKQIEADMRTLMTDFHNLSNKLNADYMNR